MRTYNIFEQIRFKVTMKLAHRLICKKNKVADGFKMLTKLAWKMGFKDYADMANQMGLK